MSEFFSLLVDPPPSWVGVCFVCHQSIRLGIELGPKPGDTIWLCSFCVGRAAAAIDGARRRGESSSASDEELTSLGGGREE